MTKMGKQEHDRFPVSDLRIWGLGSGHEEPTAQSPPNTQKNQVSSALLPQFIWLLSSVKGFPRVNDTK